MSNDIIATPRIADKATVAINWKVEWPLIKEAAVIWGVNAYMLAAMRKAESGPAGLEWGIRHDLAPTYQDQLRIACITVAHRMAGWNGVLYTRCGQIAIKTPAFIMWFASNNEWGGWAPVGAPNDPNGLNQYWPENVIALQTQYAQQGGPS